ncbi:MAG: hypothetical protein U5Q16_10540 [Gammaproteobacteria bacterium]|nr:hypothetical protein [Gammaproteobacteria bacterium]
MKARLALAVIAAFLAANGAFMLAMPTVWYYSIDSVPLSGPLNIHFVRDIGCAYLAASIGVMCAALRRDWLLPGGLTALVFIGGHALVHAVEALAGQAQGLSAMDLLGIYGPPAGLLAVVCMNWPAQSGREA